MKTSEEKNQLGYTDHGVGQECTTEESKMPSAKQLQQQRDKMKQIWDNEDSITDTCGASMSSATASSMLAFLTSDTGNQGSAGGQPAGNRGLPGSGLGNRKARGCKAKAAPGSGAADSDHQLPSVNMALEAAKYKKNTVKDRAPGIGKLGGP